MSMVTRRWPPAAGPQYATGSRNVRWAERGYLTCIVFADLVFEWRNDAFFCAPCPWRGAPKTCPGGLCARWKLLTQSREPRLRDCRRRPRRHALERPDLHLAPLDRAARSVVGNVAELKSERPLRESAVLDVDRLDPVQHHDQLAALGGDLVGVPPSAGLGHRRYLGEIDDRPRAVGRIGPLVVDIHFIRALRADLGWFGRADEDPAVRVVIRPELGPDHEILVGVLRDEVAALALVGDDRAPFGAPVGVADPVPVLEARAAVDKRHPPLVPLGHAGAPEGAEQDDQQPDGDARQAFHRDPPRWLNDSETNPTRTGLQPMCASAPPSTGSATPVMKFASSEARKSAALATSQAVPMRRRSGTRASRCAAISARGFPLARARVSTAIGVSIRPGRMTLARTPNSAFWIAICWVYAIIPALVALYATYG